MLLVFFSMEAAAAGARLEGVSAAATTGARMEGILLSMDTWRPRIFFSMVESWVPWRRPWKQNLEVVQSTTCFLPSPLALLPHRRAHSSTSFLQLHLVQLQRLDGCQPLPLIQE